MADQNKEWSLQLNVAGEGTFKPGSYDRVPDGCYTVVIAESWREASSGKNDDGSAKADNIVFVCEIADGPQKGKKVRRYKSVNQGDIGSVSSKEWKNLLLSVVKDPAQLEQGARNIKASLFNGKQAYIYVQNPPEGEKDAKGRTPFANVNFITKDMVAELSKAATATKAPAAAKGNGAAKGFEVVGGTAATPQPGQEADALE